MAMLNAKAKKTAPQYSFLVPKLIVRIEGRGNAIKTCVVNMEEVARALKLPAQYPSEWFGIDICAESSYVKEGGCCMISGIHDVKTLQSSLDKFVAKYVCCGECQLPGMELVVNNFFVKGKCKGCGWVGNLDMENKLTTFITKNPPDSSGLRIAGDKERRPSKIERLKLLFREQMEADQEQGTDSWSSDLEEPFVARLREETKDKKEKREKKERKEKKEKKEKKERKALKEIDDSEDEPNNKKEKKSKKSKKHDGSDSETAEVSSKKEKKGKKTKKEKKEDNTAVALTLKAQLLRGLDDSSFDSDSMSNAEGASTCSQAPSSDTRLTEVSARAFSIDSYLEIDDEDTAEIINSLTDFVDASQGNLSPEDFYAEVISHQMMTNFDGKQRLYIVLQALFGANMNEKALEFWNPTIEPFITEDMSTPDILCAFCAHVQTHPNTAKFFAVVLQQLLSKEWVDKEDFIDYFIDSELVWQPGLEKAHAAVASVLQTLS